MAVFSWSVLLRVSWFLGSLEKVATATVDGAIEEHGEADLHSAIGLSLVLGFVVMLLVDQISSRHNRGEKNNTLFCSKHLFK